MEAMNKHTEEFSLRLYTTKDLPMIESWWKGHNKPKAPSELLPPLGFIVDEAAACFLYVDSNARFVFPTWFVSNPFVDKEVRSTALDNLIIYLKRYMEMNSFKVLWTATNNTHLQERLKTSGFKETDTNSTEMIYIGGQ